EPPLPIATGPGQCNFAEGATAGPSWGAMNEEERRPPGRRSRRGRPGRYPAASPEATLSPSFDRWRPTLTCRLDQLVRTQIGRPDDLFGTPIALGAEPVGRGLRQPLLDGIATPLHQGIGSLVTFGPRRLCECRGLVADRP